LVNPIIITVARRRAIKAVRERMRAQRPNVPPTDPIWMWA
jgi:hypothetical protein